ncbi:hypothetical protein MFIFM68171_08962 [Madurella fahalii]|uniref:Uncharacterized protein n=1 Tax=Madurella fahalii TaxID=1157608 RepID=A0ABQ0GLW3_9PEZI
MVFVEPRTLTPMDSCRLYTLLAMQEWKVGTKVFLSVGREMGMERVVSYLVAVVVVVVDDDDDFSFVCRGFADLFFALPPKPLDSPSSLPQ